MNDLLDKLRVPYKAGYRTIYVLTLSVAALSFIVFLYKFWMFSHSCYMHHCKIDLLSDSILWLLFAGVLAKRWTIFLVFVILLFLNSWQNQIYFLVNGITLLQLQSIEAFSILAITIIGLIALWLYAVKVRQKARERFKQSFNETGIRKLDQKFKWTNVTLLLFSSACFAKLALEIYVNVTTTLMFINNDFVYVFLNIWLNEIKWVFLWCVIILAGIKKYRIILPLFLPIAYYIVCRVIYFWNKPSPIHMPGRALMLTDVLLIIVYIACCIVFWLELRKMRTMPNSNNINASKSIS